MLVVVKKFKSTIILCMSCNRPSDAYAAPTDFSENHTWDQSLAAEKDSLFIEQEYSKQTDIGTGIRINLNWFDIALLSGISSLLYKATGIQRQRKQTATQSCDEFVWWMKTTWKKMFFFYNRNSGSLSNLWEVVGFFFFLMGGWW